MSAVALTVAYKQTYQHGKNRGPCHLEEGKNRPWSVCLSVCLCVNQKQQSTCPSVSQKWACAPRLGENKTKQKQKTPVAGAVALACLSHKRSDIKRGQTTVTCCSKGVGPWPCIPGERSRQPKADKERGSGPGVFTYGQSAVGAVAPACFTHPHPYGREQKTKKNKKGPVTIPSDCRM